MDLQKETGPFVLYNNPVWTQMKPLTHCQNSFTINIHSLTETPTTAELHDFNCDFHN